MLFSFFASLLHKQELILFSNKQINAIDSSLEIMPNNLLGGKSGYARVFAFFYLLSLAARIFCSLQFNLVFKLPYLEFLVCWFSFSSFTGQLCVLKFLCSFTKMISQLWSVFAPSQSILKAVTLDDSAYYGLHGQLMQSSRRGGFWAFRFLANTSLGSCDSEFTLVSEQISFSEPARANTEASVSEYCSDSVPGV